MYTLVLCQDEDNALEFIHKCYDMGYKWYKDILDSNFDNKDTKKFINTTYWSDNKDSTIFYLLDKDKMAITYFVEFVRKDTIDKIDKIIAVEEFINGPE